MESTDNTGHKLFVAQSPFMPHGLLCHNPPGITLQSLFALALPIHFEKHGTCYFEVQIHDCRPEVHLHMQPVQGAANKVQATAYAKDRGNIHVDLDLNDFDTLPLVYAPLPMYLSHFNAKQQYMVLKSLYQMPFMPHDMLDVVPHLEKIN